MNTDVLGVLLPLVALGGGLLSGLLGGAGRGVARKLWNIPVCLGLSVLLFALGLYGYARLCHIPFSLPALFPDKVSFLVASGLYVLAAMVVGLFFGGLQAGSMERYFKVLFSLPWFAPGLVVCLAGCGAAMLLPLVSVFAPEAQTLVISEVCPNNFNLLSDQAGSFSDYIELYNSSNSPIDLSLYCLSDDRKKPEKYRLPSGQLAPGEYVIVWADGTDSSQEGELHAGFRIAQGETIFLSGASGKILQTVPVETAVANVSVCNVSGGYLLAYGTPGQPNENCTPYQAASLTAPDFSLPCGFYPQDTVTVEINAPRGCTIHYTTDGSIPDENAPVYTAPLTFRDKSSQPNQYVDLPNMTQNYEAAETDSPPVTKANILRAIAIDKKGNFSPVVTATYFVGQAAKEYEDVWVLSIVSDPEGLFGDNGICVTGKDYDHWYLETDRTEPSPTPNFFQKGRQWEREAYVQLWSEDGELVLDQACGIRVQGNSYRQFATKRFSFYAREHYSGSDLFEDAFFPSGELSHSFATRSDDADMIAQDLLQDRELSSQEGIPVMCFLDGEFYVSTYIRQRTDATFFAQRYTVPEENIVIVEADSLDAGTEKDLTDYKALMELMTLGDVTDPVVYAQIEKQIDLQSLTDFLAATLYCGNLDVSTAKNFKLWRVNGGSGEGYADGRWRAAAYDMDAVVWGYHVRTEREEGDFVDLDTFRYCLIDEEKYGQGQSILIRLPFFQNLLKNDSFRDLFIRTYLDMMNTNFSMDSYGGSVYARYPGVRENFWPSFLSQRQPYAIEHLKYALDITEPNSTLTISIEGQGTVSVGTTTAYTQTGLWTGTYISGMELTITAEGEEGWVFAGWKQDCTSSEAEQQFLLDENGLKLTAVFVPAGGEK